MVAYDAETGLARAREWMPDIIFHEVLLPPINGFHAAWQLCTDAEFANTFLVAMYAHDPMREGERANLAGFDLHVAKPIDIQAIKDILVTPPPGASRKG